MAGGWRSEGVTWVIWGLVLSCLGVEGREVGGIGWGGFVAKLGGFLGGGGGGGVKWVIDSVLGVDRGLEGVVGGVGEVFLKKNKGGYLMSLTSTSLLEMA